MKKGLFAIAVVCACSFLVGCATGNYSDPRHIGTQIDLNQKNFKMVKAGAQGTDSGFRLLGIFPLNPRSETEAMKDLYSKVNIDGKATTLINVVKEKFSYYFILFSIPKITVSADVIEFIDEPETSAAKAVEEVSPK